MHQTAAGPGVPGATLDLYTVAQANPWHPSDDVGALGCTFQPHCRFGNLRGVKNR